MEKISAACAMEWSIELEKALRSKKPGVSVEAISKMGPRLVQWSGEPEPTMGMYNMFGLVPGEDRLFANTILLRLADAFKSGNNHIRLAVVKVFLLEHRHGRKRKRNKQCMGILSKGRINNHVELLKRVKFVFDTGDVESKALAVILFGCWVEFAKDNAHIRYLIFSGLVSSHALEVNASLAAAGSFCELADDFAAVFLEILLNLMASSSALCTRLTGARVLSKMRSSYSIDKAYRMGKELLLGSSEEDFMVAMLVSLSKLASKSILLIPQQVDALLSFLSQERSVRMRAMSLSCLHFVITKGAYHTIGASARKTLVDIVDDHALPLTLQCKVLRMWHKMILHAPLYVSCNDYMLEFSRLQTIAKSATDPPSKRFLAFHILTDLLAKLGKQTMVLSSNIAPSSALLQTILLTVDQMILLLKPWWEHYQTGSREVKEFQCLLISLYSLVKEHPDLGVFVLDRICTLVVSIMSSLSSSIEKSQECSLVTHSVVSERVRHRGMGLKIVYHVYVFLLNYLENYYEACTISSEVLEKLKILVESVRTCKYVNGYAHTLYSFLLYSPTIWGCMTDENKETCIFNKSLQNCLAENEVVSLHCAKTMLEEKDYWPAYKTGTHAACQGAWATATFIFMQLVTKVRSDVNHCWLQTLAKFAQSEMKILVFLLPNFGCNLVDLLEKNELKGKLLVDDFGEICLGATRNINRADLTEVLTGAYNVLCSSGDTLESVCTVDYSFQLWFIRERAKVLEAVAETLKLLGSFPSDKDSVKVTGNDREGFSAQVLSFLQQVAQISMRFKRLAQEFDLMATSFIGMDSRSLSNISSIALGCSLLSFSCAYVFFFPSLLGNETISSFSTEKSGCFLHAMVTEDLLGRLWNTDGKTSADLCLLAEACGLPKNCFHRHSTNLILNRYGGVRDTLALCRYSVSCVLGLKNQANKRQEEIQFQDIKDRLRLLSNIIMKWMHVPFRIPKFFFKVRPCIGSELFAFSTGSSNPNRISVLPGCHLPLHLCLQLRNVPPDLSYRVTDLHCILSCRVSCKEHRTDEEEKEPVKCYCRPWKDENDMVEMNEKLFCYVTKCSNTSDSWVSHPGNDCEIEEVIAFASIKVNERGQGFSSCLLDVSRFPVGHYRIKWQSCCVDNHGQYWSLLPLNTALVFEVQNQVLR